MKSNISIYFIDDKKPTQWESTVMSNSIKPIEIICTNIDLNPQFEKQIKKLANEIYISIQQNAKLPNQKNPEKIQLALDFLKREFKVNKFTNGSMGKHTLTQEFSLLKEAINKGQIHWTTGFILFENWQKKSPAKVVEQFRKIVARLNTILGISLLVPQKENPKGLRCWELNKNIQITTKTQKAKEIIIQIENTENKNQIAKILLMSLYSYPDSVEISRLFVNLIKKRNLKFKEGIKDRLWDSHSILKNRMVNLKSAINIIKIEGDKNNWLGNYKEANEYLREIEDELNIIASAYNIAENLLSNTQKSDDEKICFSLANQLEVIREGNESIIESFMQEKLVDTSLTIASARFKKSATIRAFKNLDFKEIKQEAFICMLSAIKGEKGGRINLRKIREFRTSQSVINHISEIVYYRLIRSFLIQEIGIEQSKQNYFWEFLKTHKKLIEKNIQPDDKNILKELGKKSSAWDLDMIYEMKSYEDKIKGNIDITNEHEYYEKVLNKDLFVDDLDL